MTTFLIVCGTMIGTTILNVAFMCGGLEIICEKLEKERKKK